MHCNDELKVTATALAFLCSCPNIYALLFHPYNPERIVTLRVDGRRKRHRRLHVNAPAARYLRSHCVTWRSGSDARYTVQARFEQAVSVNTRGISRNIGRVTIFTPVACRPIEFFSCSRSSRAVVFICVCRRRAASGKGTIESIVLMHATHPKRREPSARILSNSCKMNYFSWTLYGVFT